MGAAVEVFADSRLIEVGRDRFVPVKTTNDLLVLRSDVYDIGTDFVLDQVAAEVPFVDLDGDFYKLVGDFDKRFPEGAPSMRKASSLTVDGDLTFGHGVQVVGDVELEAELGAAGRRPTPCSRPMADGHQHVEPCDRRRAPRADPRRRSAAAAGRRSRCSTPSAWPAAEDVVAADLAAELRQLRDGRVRRARTTTSLTATAEHAGAPAGRRRDRRRPGHAARAVARHRGQDHDRRTDPGRRRRGRALRVDRPRRRPGPDRPGARAGPARPAGRRGRHRRRPARLARAPCSARASSACSPPSAAPPCWSRPRPRVVVISTGSELRDPGTALGHDSIYDGNSYLLAAAVRRAGAIAYRVGIVPDEPRRLPRRAAATSWCAPTSSSPAAASRRATSTWSRRRCAARAPSGSARSRCSPASRRASAWSARTGPRSSRCRATRSRRTSPSRCSCSPRIRTMMGLTPYSRPTVDGAGSPTRSRRRAGRRQFVRGESAPTTQRARTSTPVGGPGSHLIGDLAQANALIVVPEDVTALDAGDRVPGADRSTRSSDGRGTSGPR